MISGAVHRSPVICLTAKENPGKSQLGDRLMKDMTIHCLKWGPFPPNEVGRIKQHVGEGDGRKEGNEVLVERHPVAVRRAMCCSQEI